ncbi:hypothetical protein EVAR_39033_1 [Eumeta japonica]|uniref:Uncharacterized protein n=1 Tax=Eumeta variegata TaxID=151549 RepID=A0A4C1WRD2_EUMVA|nr:hypothetical protein EVAR_39033_1 [Eumeta japonica]
MNLIEALLLEVIVVVGRACGAARGGAGAADKGRGGGAGATLAGPTLRLRKTLKAFPDIRPNRRRTRTLSTKILKLTRGVRRPGILAVVKINTDYPEEKASDFVDKQKAGDRGSASFVELIPFVSLSGAVRRRGDTSVAGRDGGAPLRMIYRWN